jgi:hypothetical protein
MSSITIKNATVWLTTVTLTELMDACEDAKEKGLTQVTIRSEFVPIEFVVDLKPETESLGYQMVIPEKSSEDNGGRVIEFKKPTRPSAA